MGIGLVGVAGGIALAAGALSIERDTRAYWSTALIVMGAGGFATAIYSLAVESPVERAYRTAYAPSPVRVTFGAAPVAGGGAAGVHGTF